MEKAAAVAVAVVVVVVESLAAQKAHEKAGEVLVALGMTKTQMTTTPNSIAEERKRKRVKVNVEARR